MLVVPAVLGPAFLVLPLAGLLIRAAWATLLGRLAEPQGVEARRLSLVTFTRDGQKGTASRSASCS